MKYFIGIFTAPGTKRTYNTHPDSAALRDIIASASDLPNFSRDWCDVVHYSGMMAIIAHSTVNLYAVFVDESIIGNDSYDILINTLNDGNHLDTVGNETLRALLLNAKVASDASVYWQNFIKLSKEEYSEKLKRYKEMYDNVKKLDNAINGLCPVKERFDLKGYMVAYCKALASLPEELYQAPTAHAYSLKIISGRPNQAEMEKVLADKLGLDRSDVIIRPKQK